MNHALMIKYGRIPYVIDGDNYLGVDCHGFVKMYLQDTRGIVLPRDTFAWRKLFRRVKATAPMLKDDIVVMAAQNKLKLVDHIGIAISSTEIMHASSQFGGVVCQPRERLEGMIVCYQRLKNDS